MLPGMPVCWCCCSNPSFISRWRASGQAHCKTRDNILSIGWVLSRHNTSSLPSRCMLLSHLLSAIPCLLSLPACWQAEFDISSDYFLDSPPDQKKMVLLQFRNFRVFANNMLSPILNFSLGKNESKGLYRIKVTCITHRIGLCLFPL